MNATAHALMTQKEQKNAAKDGKLLAWKCNTCGHKSFTPMYICPKDRSKDIGTAELPNEGKLLSFTVQKISIEEFINDVPFAFVVVEMDDGTHVSGWVPDVSSDRDLSLGTRVRYTPTYKPGYMFEKA